MRDDTLRIFPLGGLGEIGMNCMLLETEESAVLVDCGLMFPDDRLLGVDVVIPRFDAILEKKHKLKGIILTHGHEDHIGALPWLLPHVDVPVYGSDFTLALVRHKLKEHDLEESTRFRVVEDNERITIDDLAVNFFPVCHSIIRGFGLGIETPIGKIVHTGDFKIDRYPMNGHATDLDAFADFSKDGVLLMFSDSTNVEQEGFALTEREIKSTFTEHFKAAEGRIIVTLFSSHIQRIQEIFDLAAQMGRKVAVSGKSLYTNIDIAREHGFLNFDDSIYVNLDQVSSFEDDEIVLLVTGSQGEPLSALTRIAAGEHRFVGVKPGDLVLMSSRFIPGNVRAITRVINSLYRQGADVLYEKVQGIHASGHAYREELKLMLETVNPKFFIPVHGEYRHLVKHSRLVVDCGIAPERAIVLENGSPLLLSPDGVQFEDDCFVEGVLVDGKGVGDVGRSVIKERRILGGEGMVLVVLIIDEDTGNILVGPEIMSKGFVFEQHYSHLLEDSKCIVLELFEEITPDDPGQLKDRIRSQLRRFFRQILGRDPVVVPLVMSV